MKGTLITSHEFKPFTIGITIEGEQEARALYALFNHEQIRKLLGVSMEVTSDIRAAISKGAHGALDYHSKFQELSALMR